MRRRTQLSRQRPLQRKSIYTGITIGACLGSIVGTAILILGWQETVAVNVLFGATSAAVIGGLFGFWTTSLYQVARGALTEAHRDS